MIPARLFSTGRRNRTKLVAVLSVIVLAVMALLGYLIWSGYQEAMREAGTTTRNYAAIIEARLDATLRRADAEMQALARTLPVAVLSKQAVPRHARELDAELDSRLINFPELAGLQVFDAHGDVLYLSDSTSNPRTNIADRSHFRLLRDNPQAGLVFSEVIIGRATDRQIVIAARALRDGQGAFRGVVSATIELESFQKLFQSLDIGALSVLTIYRSDDFRLVVRWPLGDAKINTPLPPGHPIREALTFGNTKTTVELSSVADGIVRIYSSHVLDRYPFFVTAGVAREEVLAGWRARALAVGLSGLLLLGLLAGLLFRLRRVEARQAQMMADLAESEGRFRAIFNYAGVGITMRPAHDRRLPWVQVNDQFCKLLGYTREELLRLSTADITPSDEQEDAVNDNERLMRGEIGNYVREKRVLRKDGHGIWVILAVAALPDADGQPRNIIAIYQDITGRKQAEEALKISEANLRAISDNANIGILINLQGRHVFSNPHLQEMLGYTAGELKQTAIQDIVSRDEQPKEADRHRRRLAGENVPHQYESVVLSKDGRAIPVEFNATIIRWNGQAADMVFISDITARKQAEAQRQALETQLRQSQKMEAIGTLAGGIAHDFNNVLAAIIGNAELARQDVGAEHPALKSLDEIRKAGQRAKALVNQILAFSRQQPQSLQPIALAPVMEEVVKLLRATLPAGVEIAVTAADDTPNVLADPTQIHQIVLNLCTNAWHALEGNPGRIDIRLDGITLDAGTARPGLQPGRYAYLSVHDTGRGMDAATLEHIFEPFFTTKPVGEGIGLGLSVVHGIMETHQGIIRVESTPGRGTTVHLYFPAIAPTAQTSGPELEITTPLRGSGQHVLYLDDEDALVLLATHLLQRMGYEVSGYIRAEDALAAVRADAGRFDLVVTDYNMPGMSGLDVANELARIRPDLPVVITSGYISDELRQKARQAGVRHLIYKPNTVEELCETVHTLTSELRR